MVTCKCGATTYDRHVVKVARGYTAHVYRGPYGWGHQAIKVATTLDEFQCT